MPTKFDAFDVVFFSAFFAIFGFCVGIVAGRDSKNREWEAWIADRPDSVAVVRSRILAQRAESELRSK